MNHDVPHEVLALKKIVARAADKFLVTFNHKVDEKVVQYLPDEAVADTLEEFYKHNKELNAVDLFANIYKASTFTPNKLVGFEQLEDWLQNTKNWDHFYEDINEAIVHEALMNPDFHESPEAFNKFKEVLEERRAKDPRLQEKSPKNK